MAADRSLTANLARYPLFVGGTSALFWIPVTFLFFLDEFGLSEALQLGAIYYLAVVVLEVPSGWFSDRVGRVPTLRLVAVGWLGSFTALALADHFAVAALGQVLQAVGWSFLSGTDVTFHYDSLEALGRDDEFEARESLARRNGMIVRAIAVVSGGALGMIDLRLPFVAGIGVAAYLGVVSLGLHEPPRERVRGSFRRDVASVADRFRVRLLGWLLAYVIAQIILEHLASEFAGPYLAAVLGEELTDVDRAPLLTGVLAAAVALVGAAAVGRAVGLRDRLGLVGALVAVAVIPTVTVVTMALVTSAAVVALLALRNVQIAVAGVLIPAAVGARVPQHHRATFLSITSLAGRLAYGIVLLSLSATADFDTTLRWAAVIAIAALGAVITTGIGVRDE